jgi:uncharacterized protein
LRRVARKLGEDRTSVKRRRTALLYLRGAMIFLALLLPLASLLPLGWLWLWQHGYALYWLAAAFAIAACAFLVQVIALRRSVAQTPIAEAADEAATVAPDPGWSAREQAAWAAVEAIATGVRPDELTDRDKVLNLGLRTIEAVARQIHPQDRNPLWKFTIPEALALIERVSADLRPFVIENIPLGDQLTVGQVLKVYGWRSAVGFAEKAYDIWRLVRLVNPVTAAAQEAREQITRHLYATVRDELARQLAGAYVREVGRAAIDLYGGRLRVSVSALAGHVSASTLRDRRAGPPLAEPLRVLVAGRAGAGKSSLVNALSKEVGALVDALPATLAFQAYDMELAGLTSALVIDAPGIGTTPKEQRRFLERAEDCDLILWVIDAREIHSEVDRQAITGIRKHYSNRPHRREPPILVALTHVDLLAPSAEWSPPYDTEAPRSAKARSIRDAMDAVAGNLDVERADVVPVSVRAGTKPYNVGQLSERIAARITDAQRAQLLRLMEDAAPRWSVTRLGKQASNAALSAARAVTPGYFRRWIARQPRE